MGCGNSGGGTNVGGGSNDNGRGDGNGEDNDCGGVDGQVVEVGTKSLGGSN